MKFRSNEHALNEALIQERWPEFEAIVPNDEVGLEIVFQAFSMLGLFRCACGSPTIVREACSRTFSCSRCRAKVWFTAGTMFYRVKQFKAWLGSIWMMENGVALAGCRLAKLAGVALATAHHIQKTIRLVVENCFDVEAPSVPSALFASILTKRSRTTSADTHPSDELETVVEGGQAAEESKPGFNDYQSEATGFTADGAKPGQANAQFSSSNLSENELKVLDCISFVPVSFDSLCVLTGLSAGIISSAVVMLELFDLIVSLDGNFFVRKKMGQSSHESREIFTEAVCSVIHSTNHFIWSFHHGVSFKWLQSFLAMIWFFSDRERWTRGSLLVACMKSGPISANRLHRTRPSRLVVFPAILRTVAN